MVKKGYKQTEEHKKKRFRYGENNHFFGKHHTEETKQKLKEKCRNAYLKKLSEGWKPSYKPKIITEKQREASRKNIIKFNKEHTGEKHPKWKGGKYRTKEGYILIRKIEHPRAKNNSGYVAEHILKMENKINRYLNQNEVVHHINGIKDDNREENLIVLTKSEHSKIHTEQKNKNRINGRWG